MLQKKNHKQDVEALKDTVNGLVSDLGIGEEEESSGCGEEEAGPLDVSNFTCTDPVTA